MAKKIKFEAIQSIGDTQYRVEQRKGGLWSGDDEICIAHVLRGRRARRNPSIPIILFHQLITKLIRAYEEMTGQKFILDMDDNR